MPNPVFIFITRSFWFAVGAFALFVGQGKEVVEAAAVLLVTVWTWLDFLAGLAGLRLPAGDAAALTAFIMKIGPLAGFLMALQQRSGAARPYTVKPTRQTLR